MWRREKTCQRPYNRWKCHFSILMRFHFQYFNTSSFLTSWFDTLLHIFLPFCLTSTVSHKPCLHCHNNVVVLSLSFELWKTHSLWIAEQTLVVVNHATFQAGFQHQSAPYLQNHLVIIYYLHKLVQWSGRGRREIKCDNHAFTFLYRHFWCKYSIVMSASCCTFIVVFKSTIY